VARLGEVPGIPAKTMSQASLAASEGITPGTHLDGQDLHRAGLEVIILALLP